MGIFLDCHGRFTTMFVTVLLIAYCHPRTGGAIEMNILYLRLGMTNFITFVIKENRPDGRFLCCKLNVC